MRRGKVLNAWQAAQYIGVGGFLYNGESVLRLDSESEQFQELRNGDWEDISIDHLSGFWACHEPQELTCLLALALLSRNDGRLYKSGSEYSMRADGYIKSLDLSSPLSEWKDYHGAFNGFCAEIQPIEEVK